MTVRRKPTDDEPDPPKFELIGDKGVLSWRVAIVLTLVSMHPYGQLFLTNLGLPPPSAGLAREVKDLQSHAETITGQLSDVKTDIASVKQDVKLVKNQITAFEVNFDKYKKEVQ